jgi:hypothetical protein
MSSGGPVSLPSGDPGCRRGRLGFIRGRALRCALTFAFSDSSSGGRGVCRAALSLAASFRQLANKLLQLTAARRGDQQRRACRPWWSTTASVFSTGDLLL